MRILCVEDHEDTCELLTTTLGLSRIEAVAAPTAAEALRLMEAEAFGLYVIDSGLPDGDGVALCEQIRRKDKVTPIVLFSGRAYEEDRVEGLRAGANAYVVKPDVGALVSTVRRLLEKSAVSEGEKKGGLVGD